MICHYIIFCACFLSEMIRVQADKQDTPIIRPFTLPRDLKIGDKVSILCSVSSGQQPLEFHWKKDGEEIKETKNVKIHSLPDVSVITIHSVREDSMGNYTCFVSNNFGATHHTAMLEVPVSPTWKIQPSSTDVVVGQNASLYCEAKGFPIPTISWTKLENPFGEKEKFVLDYESVKNGTLFLFHAKKEDGGIYECSAKNGIGSGLKKAVSLIIKVPARFEEKYSTVTSKKGDSARLRCDAVGDQPLRITWKKGPLQLSKSRNARYEVFETLTSDGLQSELVIRETKRDDGSIYICIAENTYGTDERKVKLSILEVPGRPQNVKIAERWSRSATVAWSVPYTGNSPIAKYIVQYWREKGAPHRLHEHPISSLQTSTMIDKLHPGTSYVVNVVAENSVGRGEASKPVRFHTGEEEPSLPPVDVSIEQKGPTTIKVTWKPPPLDSWNGQLKGYYIGYKIRGSTSISHAFNFKSVEYGGERTQEYLLTKLIKGTEYCIVVQAFNAAGSGPPCHEMIERTTDADVPHSPFLSLMSVTVSSISVTWVIKHSKTPVTGFTLHYRRGYNSWKESPLIPANEKQYTLSNIDSGTFYELYLTATNQAGKSDPSDTLRVRTDFVEGYKLSSVIDKNVWNPPYFQISVLIPIAACLTSILVAIIVACVCVRKLKNERRKRGLMEDKQSNYGGTIQRYVDVEKNRPLVNNECSMSSLYPAPYATIPMRDDPDGDFAKSGMDHEMKTFVQQNHIERPIPPPRPSSLKKKVDLHLYDSPQ